MADVTPFNGEVKNIKDEMYNKLMCELKDIGNFDILPRSTHRFESNKNSDGNNKIFRIMQWNILAQGLSLCGKFVLCPKEVLQFERRLRHITLELLRYDADIICLQEVDMFEHLNKYLIQLGYRGTFLPKNPSPCLAFSDNIGPDGCAMFYKTNRLECLSTKNFHLGDEMSQVALVQLFRSIENPEITFYVTVSHFKAKPSFSHVRTVQGNNLISELKNIVKDSPSPIFVCCDMNADPDEDAVSIFKSSDFQFSSAYSLLDVAGNEPDFTTWKFRGDSHDELTESKHTIDYLWYQNSTRVTPVSVINIPSTEIIGNNALPCSTFPSDHMSLIADFCIGSGS